MRPPPREFALGRVQLALESCQQTLNRLAAIGPEEIDGKYFFEALTPALGLSLQGGPIVDRLQGLSLELSRELLNFVASSA